MTEEQEQQQVVAWFKREYGPALAECLHHSPNGGHRHPATARRMKYLGVRRGFPDLVLYLPGREPDGWDTPGCALELKQTDSGSDCSDYQYDWLARLERCGFEVHGPVNGENEAKEILAEYMTRAGYEPGQWQTEGAE